MLSQSSSQTQLEMLSATPNSKFISERLRGAFQAYRDVCQEEPTEYFVALVTARALESVRRKELLLADPYFREQALKETNDYWVRLTQSWIPPDWHLTQETSPGDR